MMSSVKINIDSTQKILLERKLDKGGQGQRFFTSEVQRLSDSYVPFDTGMLKNNVSMSLQGDSIIYHSPYAKRQFYEHKGKGLRGKNWTGRCWADRGREITQSVAKFVGGRSK